MKLKNAKLIKEHEGLKLTAYKPTPNDVWTIGWGHTQGVFPGMTITLEEAEVLFDKDNDWAEKAVNTYVKVPLSQNQFDALVSFVFNVGAPDFLKSTMLRKLNRGDYEGAAAEFPRWNKQKGHVLNGLTRRRAEEMQIFLSGIGSAAVVKKGDKVEGPAPLKPMYQSKELIGGILAALSGGGALFGPDLLEKANTFSVGLSVALGVMGLILIFNRVRARKNGDR